MKTTITIDWIAFVDELPEDGQKIWVTSSLDSIPAGEFTYEKKEPYDVLHSDKSHYGMATHLFKYWARKINIKSKDNS